MPTLGGFLVALALQTVGAKQEDFFHRNSTPEVGVLSFYDVWNRSSCQPMEKLVNIVSEYPCEVEHMFSPSCVSLHRCSGCCGDETLHCVPTEMTNVTMQLLRMKSGEQASYVEMSFAEHKKCLCRLRQEVPKPGRRRRPKGKGRGSKMKRARHRLKD
ncbi:PREDICTED: placenta growth factor [Gekko japonicus]|uniref:Placenta growth factor n=1 Tax=Gekko japonicus TaxID=146911 RepID=A0ABM1KQY2_GEKJA|nr:PREDICTED: placenta growth factor [Gekko japonicus]